MAKVHRSIQVQFDKGNSREETLLGREYLVVPVIAMVEGVRFGAGQTEPELGLASEFGDVPIAWANRPLVLNHPQIDGTFVSANTPDILEQYQFGMTMNPELKDNKLHMEAWIDVQRVKDLGGEFEDTYNRIVDQEDVEVSVGFFSDLRKTKGKFKGQKYGAIWTNIKPDHLAVLSEGIIGACSVKDGCGVPRINETGENMPTKSELKTTGAAGCTCGNNAPETDDEPVTQKGLKQLLAEILKPFTQSKEEKALEAHKAQREINQAIVNESLKINDQAIHSSLLNNDVYKMIAQAVQKKYGTYCYLYGYTQDVAVFESYNYNNGGYQCQQVGINVTDSAVEFVGEPQEVILQTKIVPQTSTATTTEGNNPTDVNAQENDMTTPNNTPNTPAPEPTPSNPPATPPTQPNPTTQSTEKKVLTAQEYIDQAPAEIRDMLNASLRAQETKKADLIKTLTDHKSNKFTQEYLKAQSVEVLENMVALLPSDFRGLAAPSYYRTQDNKNETVPAPKVFESKKSAA